jgi:hypothetical protein
MKKIITVLLACYATMAWSQDCSTESLLTKKGSWKMSSAGESNVSKSDLVKQKANIAQLHKMISASYSPTGVQANCNAGYQRSQPQQPVNSYAYSIIPLNFYCDGNNIKTARETSTYLQIGVNFFSAEIYDTAQGDRRMQEGYNVLSSVPVEKDGYYYFGEIDASLGFGMTGKSRTWMITRNGKLPFSYVTRKEFLERRKQNIAALIDEEMVNTKDILKNLDLEKSFKEKEFKGNAAKMQQYMKMDYQPRRDRYSGQLQTIQTKYKPVLNRLDFELNKPAAELSLFAIVKQDPANNASYLFTTENDPMARILIKPNPGYFDKKLPRSAAQFFVVQSTGNQKDPIAKKTVEDFLKAADFGKLKMMLGK